MEFEEKEAGERRKEKVKELNRPVLIKEGRTWLLKKTFVRKKTKTVYKVEYFTKNGKTKMRTEYFGEDGITKTKVRLFWKNGQPKKSISFGEDGITKTKVRLFWKNGQLKKSISAEAVCSFSEDGTLETADVFGRLGFKRFRRRRIFGNALGKISSSIDLDTGKTINFSEEEGYSQKITVHYDPKRAEGALFLKKGQEEELAEQVLGSAQDKGVFSMIIEDTGAGGGSHTICVAFQKQRDGTRSVLIVDSNGKRLFGGGLAFGKPEDYLKFFNVISPMTPVSDDSLLVSKHGFQEGPTCYECATKINFLIKNLLAERYKLNDIYEVIDILTAGGPLSLTQEETLHEHKVITEQVRTKIEECCKGGIFSDQIVERSKVKQNATVALRRTFARVSAAFLGQLPEYDVYPKFCDINQPKRAAVTPKPESARRKTVREPREALPTGVLAMSRT